jgi:WD40 repeat protein
MPPTLEVLNRDWLLPGDSSRLVVESGGHVAIIRELLFTADGRELISVGDDKTIRVWSVSSDGQRATLARTIRGQNGEGREGMIAAAALAPPDTAGHQRWLAVGGYLPGAPRDRYAIRLHDYASGEIAGLLYGHTDAVLALAFSPTGRWLASAGKDHTLRVWELTSWQGDSLARAPLVYTAHTDHIYDLAWSAPGHRLASASYDGTVGLWNTEDLAQNALTLIARLQGHDDQVLTVAFHPDGTALASGSKDRTIRTWRAADGKSLGVFAKAKHKVAALAFSPDGGLLLSGNYSPPQPDRLTLFAYPTGKEHRVFTGHHNVVMATAFHPSGQWVASGGGEQKEILLWQTHTGEMLSRLEGRGRTIYTVGFSQDGRYISWGYTADAAASHKPARLEDQFDLAQLVRLPGGLPDASAVRAQTRVGKLTLVTEAGGAYNYQYRLHIQRDDLRLGTVERGHADGYRHSAYTFTPDAQSVLSGGLNGVLRLYTLDGQLRTEFVGHTGEIKAVAVSADGRWAVSGANDQTLRLWSLTALSPSGSTQRLPTFTLFAATDGEWVAWTPEGFFAASPQGARLIGYNIDQGLNKIAKYVSAEQLRDRFYRPALIQAKLQEDKQVYSTARQPSEILHR